MPMPVQGIKPTGHVLQQALEGSGVVYYYNRTPIVASSTFNEELKHTGCLHDKTLALTP